MEQPRQLKSGKWQGRVTGPDGKRYSAGVHASKRKAQNAQSELLAELKSRKDSPEETASTNFATYAEGYLWTRRPGEPDGLAPMSYYKYQGRLRILNQTFGHLNVEDITPVMVRNWWNSYSDAPSQRRDTYQLLRTVLELAVDDELITRNPCRVPKATKRVSKARPTFTEADIAALYFATEDIQNRALLTFLGGTGMRIGEAVAMDWNHVSFFDAKASVMRHWTPRGLQDGTKSGENDTRHLALPSWVMDELERLYSLQAASGVAEGPIFKNQRGGRLSVDGAERMFRTLRTKVGLENMHLHDLRHVSLTAYGRQPGVTLADIKARGGHKSDVVAMQYQHSDSERDELMTATLPNPLDRRTNI